MNPWLLAALGLGGLYGLHLATRKTSWSADQEIQACVNAALARETDMSILSSFQTKLSAAGYTQQAQAVGARIVKLQPTRLAASAQKLNSSVLASVFGTK